MLSHLIESWVSLYANHAALRTGIEFMHIGGLVARRRLRDHGRSGHDHDGPRGRLPRVRHSCSCCSGPHLIVVLGLVALAVSGALLFAADVETFLYSRIFWLKMGLLALLLVNGLLLLRGERQVQRGDARAWAAAPLHRDRQPRVVVSDDAGGCRAAEYRIGKYGPRDVTICRAGATVPRTTIGEFLPRVSGGVALLGLTSQTRALPSGRRRPARRRAAISPSVGRQREHRSSGAADRGARRRACLRVRALVPAPEQRREVAAEGPSLPVHEARFAVQARRGAHLGARDAGTWIATQFGATATPSSSTCITGFSPTRILQGGPPRPSRCEPAGRIQPGR